MVRNYKKKTMRGNWSHQSMKAAIDKILSKKAGCRKVALEYGIPQTTLERYVKKIKQGGEITIGLPLGPIKSVFSEKEEQELAEYVKHMEERLFLITTLDLRRLAYQLADRNNKKHKFNIKKKMAGIDWLKGFLKRNADLSICKPEVTSAACAMGFNRVAVEKFYQLLGETYDAIQCTPDRIYNCDETAISVVSKTKSRIISLKGSKQVNSLSSAERGQTVTVEICFNAAGMYMPPLMIFPKQRMKAELVDCAPPGTTSACNPKGLMTTEIFTIWFKRFVQFSGASPTNKVLLLLDGHLSHTKNLDVIDLARRNGVIIICFPPYCTDKLQPADEAFKKPLSIYYEHAVSNWLSSHPGRVITMFQISEIFGQAYQQAATMSTAINGFRKCGIWPYNQDNFSDADFVAADTTNKPLAQDHPSTSRSVNLIITDTESQSEQGVSSTSSSTNLSSIEIAPHPRLEKPTTSSFVNTDPIETEPHSVKEASNFMSISAKLTSVQIASHLGHEATPTVGSINLGTEERERRPEHKPPESDLLAPAISRNEYAPVVLAPRHSTRCALI